MKEESKILLYNYGSLIYQTDSSELDRKIENIDNDSTYTLRDVLQTMLNILNSEQ